MKPALIVTVDTEEECLWSGNYQSTGNTVENTRGIPRFQTLCDLYGIRPTYLVDAPIVDDDRSVDLLRQIQFEQRGEIGAHLHPWCTPPFEETRTTRNSFLCNLPEPLQRRKLKHLTEHVEQRFGRRPTSFRAGRYGLDMTGARILHELGYEVDSSVIAFSDFSEQAGPDFRRAPFVPYYLNDGDICKPHDSGFLLEVPVSVGYNWSDFARADRLRSVTTRLPLRQLRAEGILDRLGVLRRIKFSPEQADSAQMKRLIRCFLAQDAPCIVMMFHSSSLVPGYSPYVSDSRSLERFFTNLEVTFVHCLSKHDMVGITLSDFAERWGVAKVPMQTSVDAVV